MLGPGTQVAVLRVWRLEVDVRIVLQGLVDVAKTGRHLNTLGDGEAEAHGLVELDVGILAHHHDLEVAEGYLFECVEDKFLRRIDLLRLVLALDEVVHLFKRRSFEIVA